METFFSVEPTKSYREYFNVYTVYAVSKKRQLSENWNDSALKTITDKLHGVSEYINNVNEYLSVIPASSRTVCPSIIINANNSGVTFMEYTHNYAYSGFPYNNRTLFQNTFRHESIGHGFGLLGDEYSRRRPQDITGEIPAFEKDNLLRAHRSGLFLNLSLTDDPKVVPWAHLIGHPRYPEVGIYEGGYVYDSGVWRSEGSGIMRISSDKYFNAFCRQLLVKRILTLAGETYTFEKFLENDILPTRTMFIETLERQTMERPHYPPVFYKES